MLFTQIEFALFFAVVVLFFQLLKSNSSKKVLLLLASAYFYGYWDFRFLFLIFSCVIVNFLCERMIRRTRQNASLCRFWLILSMAYSLGILAFFKYFNFFAENIAYLTGVDHDSITLNLVLPIGISFFTFQAMSFTIDSFRSKASAKTSLVDFALYVSFFPQLVAGPIVKANEFLPQLRKTQKVSISSLQTGFHIFAVGFCKKCFVADNLARIVDPVFGNPAEFSGLTLGFAVLAYSIQIFFDFSGYSDMAIGSARVLGYRFRNNFNLPYVARNISEFWHRWHISLSTWLRDYLYIPLGGSKHGSVKTARNLFLTMILGGLWHGASWNFVIWGAWHGIALVIYHAISRPSVHSNKQLLNYFSTMFVVLVGWVFFRASTFENATSILFGISTLQEGISFCPPFWVVFVGLFWVWSFTKFYFNFQTIDFEKPSLHSTVLVWCMFWAGVVLSPNNSTPFIYFQF